MGACWGSALQGPLMRPTRETVPMSGEVVSGRDPLGKTKSSPATPTSAGCNHSRPNPSSLCEADSGLMFGRPRAHLGTSRPLFRPRPFTKRELGADPSHATKHQTNRTSCAGKKAQALSRSLQVFDRQRPEGAESACLGQDPKSANNASLPKILRPPTAVRVLGDRRSIRLRTKLHTPSDKSECSAFSASLPRHSPRQSAPETRQASEIRG